MSIIITLFFISLLGIIFMISRKLVLVQNGQLSHSREASFQIPYIREIRHVTVKNIKVLGHASLVGTIRLYVRSSNFLKNKYVEIKIKIRNQYSPKVNLSEGKEISKFLKIISDYKHRIKEIKHKIHEEEKNL